MPPQRSTASSTSRSTSSSSATSTVMPTPSANAAAASSAPLQVGDDDARALGGEPVGDRAADALRAAGDDRDLAVERAHQRIGENGVGIEDAVLLRVDQRLDLGEERLPARRPPAAARAAPRARRSSS